MDQKDAVTISISGLTKTYNFGRVKALDGISLEIKPGEVFGLIGPNGAGKTTLMGCMLGLLRPTQGSIQVAGHPVNDLAIKRMTGFMPERPNFDKWMTVNQFLLYHHLLSGQSFSGAKKNIEESLVLVELEQAAWKRPLRKLSRGMLQRVGLAQVLIGQPTLCFLDEPTSGMDPLGMALVRTLLLRWKSRGATVVLNSHHLDEVERICDRVAFIQRGKIQAVEEMAHNGANSIFIVKWNGVNGTGGPDIQDIFKRLSQTLGVTARDTSDSLARFVLEDPAQSVEIVRFLVNNGLPLSEAIHERKTLLDLFIAPRTEGGNGN